jgi:hypothetical protein
MAHGCAGKAGPDAEAHIEILIGIGSTPSNLTTLATDMPDTHLIAYN